MIDYDYNYEEAEDLPGWTDFSARECGGRSVMKHIGSHSKAKMLPGYAVQTNGVKITINCNQDTSEDGKKCDVVITKLGNQQ